MKLDDAKAKIDEGFLEVLKDLIVAEFRAEVLHTKDADVHFEDGFRALVKTEVRLVEIVTRVIQG